MLAPGGCLFGPRRIYDISGLHVIKCRGLDKLTSEVPLAPHSRTCSLVAVSQQREHFFYIS